MNIIKNRPFPIDFEKTFAKERLFLHLKFTKLYHDILERGAFVNKKKKNSLLKSSPHTITHKINFIVCKYTHMIYYCSLCVV